MADGKARRRPATFGSGSSSGSEEELGKVLWRTKTPRSATCCTPRTPKERLNDSKGDFFWYLRRKYASASKASQLSEKRGASTGSPLLSDSDDDSVFTDDTPRNPNRPGQGACRQPPKCQAVFPTENAARKPCSGPSLSEREEHSVRACAGNTTWTEQRGARTVSGSDSSDEEIDSLIMRVKRRMCLSSEQSVATPNSTAEEGHAKPSLGSLSETGKSKRALLTRPEVPVPAPLSKTEASCDDVSLLCQAPKGSLCRVQGCFLQDLSDPRSQQSKHFWRKKEELVQNLYAFYNLTVFEQKLPERMEIAWNKKMRKTAGCCITGQLKDPVGQRYARIMLSEKVCDSAERLRDTLIHELCHAAVWLIHGVHDGHGRFWSLYAKKSTAVHPELPMVSRCHNYEINYKVIYECSRCKNTIGRHSKSLDTQRFVCALCKGPLVLCQPRQKNRIAANAPLTPFAKYVKDHYGTAKRLQKDLTHGAIMKQLSAEFAAQNLGRRSPSQLAKE